MKCAENHSGTMKYLKRFALFTCSGASAFVLDCALFCLIVRAFNLKSDEPFFPLAIAVSCARIVSAHWNYLFNRYIVFNAGLGLVSYWRYFELVVLVGGASWLCTSIIVKALLLEGAQIPVAKVVIDLILFFLSYIVQSRFIFPTKKGVEDERQDCRANTCA